MGDEGGGGRGGSTKEMGGGEEGPFSVSPIPRRRAQAGDRWCLNGWQAAGARGGVELISTGIGMTKADMIPKFLVLFWFFFEWLIIVGVGKERVGEETRGGALPLVGAAEGLTLLGSQIYCGSRLGEDGSCLLALGPIGAHRKQLGMLASPTTKILVFVGDCVDNCGCRGCCQTGALTSMEELD